MFWNILSVHVVWVHEITDLWTCLQIYEALHLYYSLIIFSRSVFSVSSDAHSSTRIPPRPCNHISASCISPKHFCPIVSGTTIFLLSLHSRSIVTPSNLDSQEKFVGLYWQDSSMCWLDHTGSILDYGFKPGASPAVREGGLFNPLEPVAEEMDRQSLDLAALCWKIKKNPLFSKKVLNQYS